MSSISESWVSRVFFIMIVVLGIFGNSLVLLIYRKHKTFRKTSFDMLIINLALSDLLAAVFLIFSRFLYLPAMPSTEPGAFLLCNFFWGGYILFGLAYVSVYTCVLLTIERWLAVFRPLLYRQIKKYHVLRAIAIVWLWAFFINSTVFISVNRNFKEGKCEWKKEPQVAKGVLPWLELLVSCLLPFTAMFALYAQIFYKIRIATNQSTVMFAASRRLTVIVLLTVTALVVGWLPVKISFVLRYTSVGSSHLNGTAHFIFIMIALGNCCVNPFLYGFSSSKFRNEYKDAIRAAFKKVFKPSLRN